MEQGDWQQEALSPGLCMLSGAICPREPKGEATCFQSSNAEVRVGLLLGRKVMNNLDSILKSRDITLPTTVCLVKAMVFPVVMYGCES